MFTWPDDFSHRLPRIPYIELFFASNHSFVSFDVDEISGRIYESYFNSVLSIHISHSISLETLNSRLDDLSSLCDRLGTEYVCVDADLLEESGEDEIARFRGKVEEENLRILWIIAPLRQKQSTIRKACHIVYDDPLTFGLALDFFFFKDLLSFVDFLVDNMQHCNIIYLCNKKGNSRISLFDVEGEYHFGDIISYVKRASFDGVITLWYDGKYRVKYLDDMRSITEYMSTLVE